jgi:hypothetical protein
MDMITDDVRLAPMSLRYGPSPSDADIERQAGLGDRPRQCRTITAPLERPGCVGLPQLQRDNSPTSGNSNFAPLSMCDTAFKAKEVLNRLQPKRRSSTP